MKRSALPAAVLPLAFARARERGSRSRLTSSSTARFPPELTAAENRNRVACVFGQQGRGNAWVAEVPGFAARELTKYNEDDGQDPSDLSLSSIVT